MRYAYILPHLEMSRVLSEQSGIPIPVGSICTVSPTFDPSMWEHCGKFYQLNDNVQPQATNARLRVTGYWWAPEWYHIVEIDPEIPEDRVVEPMTASQQIFAHIAGSNSGRSMFDIQSTGRLLGGGGHAYYIDSEYTWYR